MQNVDQAIKNTQASAPFDNAVDIHRKEIKIKTLAETQKILVKSDGFDSSIFFAVFQPSHHTVTTKVLTKMIPKRKLLLLSVETMR